MQQKKILVGISGGVDSAVALALLKNENYATSAVFLRFWDPAGKNNRALADAKNVCAILDVPFSVVDARAKFKKTVLKYFLDEYAKGNTPNPCIFCNEKMKFKLLFETAKKMGIEMVATGHYARLCREFPPPAGGSNFQPCLLAGRFSNKCNSPISEENAKDGAKYKLVVAKDKNKDQSYFLYRLKQEQLARIIFPLGEYQKADVRKLAEKFRLPVFDKSDSQDVCFMADNNLEKFLAEKINLKKGKIINTEGKIVGQHRGLPLYTIGQRKGIEIGGTGPYFVVAKNVKKNELTVTNEPHHPAITQKITMLQNVTWTNGDTPKLPLSVTVRTRYRNPLVCAIIRSSKNRNTYHLEFKTPQKAISPGQSVVFYSKKAEILGGGVIN